ncbi:amino acid adenylation domain-containing protein [Polyangium aurulentum]|uniref:amino acid adenylation domain-containing protein n=1 Tax=Polyangium aurulentum TaxID=2567896 RepID=UPI00146AD231|nr:amino acid adenylation domain-containing protein [Polyangium aurulentum]UQA59897.1 amino acid adenylation domain-containing protein [Polyangium aurulentum]
MTTEQEHSRFPFDVNQTAAPHPESQPVHALFEEQATRTPEAVAAIAGSRSVTYADLARNAQKLASLLRRSGVSAGSRVAILLERSPDMLIALLGTLKAGAAYVPLEPSHPEAYLRSVVNSCGAVLVLTEPALAERLRDLPVRKVFLSEIDGEFPDGEAPVLSPEDPAYVLYTSGTTGRPKGVVVPHRALTNYVWWARALYLGSEPGVLPLYSSLAFDLTVTSIFVPLIGGGTVVAYAGSSTAVALMDALEDNRVDTVKLTPSHLSLVTTGKNHGSKIRRLIVGGEILPTALARRALESFGPDVAIWNEYGPTEATVGCVVHRFDPERDTRASVPIGRPAANSRVYVLRDGSSIAAEGETGELFLAGACLALGYLDDPGRTRESFLESPLVKGEIMYRTGDLARFLPGGLLEFLGRNDTQVKFNGHRVELEGLKAILDQHPAVRDSVVLVDGDAGSARSLVAYYAADEEVDPQLLRRFMGETVSQEIIPQYFIRVPALPLTASGKLDTSALPRLSAWRAGMQRMSASPGTRTEEELHAIWCKSLGVSEIGVDDDFFEIGGHSLLANQLILRIREALGVDLNMRSIFECRTIRALSRSIELTRESREVRVASEAQVAAADAGELLPKLVRELDARPEVAMAPEVSGKKSDDENLVLAESITAVDERIGEFYSRFPWPWNSSKFDTLADPDFERIMLSQEVGDYSHAAVPRDASIWVAGCGTNQALLTALLFPHAQVLGTDLSTKSIEICAENAAQLGVENLTLRLESINDAPYEEQFDFIVCTGVIHHTYDPAHALGRLSRALKREGLLELLVYNRFHRTITSAFQKAIRVMTKGLSADDYAVAKRIAAGFALDNTIARFVSRHRDWEESDFADLLINPVEHSFTVDSLSDMAQTCNLDLLRPCISLYAKYRAENIFWEMSFSDPDIQRVYDAMEDVDRWRVSNLLMHEKSPMLWFYLRRKDAEGQRRSEKLLNEAFLQTTFARATTEQKSFIRGKDGRFRLSPRANVYPSAAPEEAVKAIYERFDRSRVMGEVFAELGVEPTFANVQRARLYLTTPAFPYLRAVDG